jgi:hypothetical protein
MIVRGISSQHPKPLAGVFVYLLRRLSPPVNLYKIGFAVDVLMRALTLSRSNGITVEIIAYVEVSDRCFESQLHRDFGAYRRPISGEEGGSEWFALTDKAVRRVQIRMMKASRSFAEWQRHREQVLRQELWEEEQQQLYVVAPPRGVYVCSTGRVHMMQKRETYRPHVDGTHHYISLCSTVGCSQKECEDSPPLAQQLCGLCGGANDLIAWCVASRISRNARLHVYNSGPFGDVLINDNQLRWLGERDRWLWYELKDAENYATSSPSPA